MDIEKYSKHTNFYTEDIPRILEEYLKTTIFYSFADIGCGDGSLLYALNKKDYLKNKKVYAVDLSSSRIKLVKEINNKFNCIIGDAQNIPLPNDSIDFLVSTQVIEHVLDDSKMVREIDRILSKNGIVYITTVFKKWYGWYFYRCNGRWRLDPTHLREYTNDNQLLNIIRKNGFKIFENRKILLWFPVLDFVLKKLKISSKIYLNNKFLASLKFIKLPIAGYYNWELIFGRKMPHERSIQNKG